MSGILYRHDPMGLANAEAPKNEYDLETAEILAGLKKCSSSKDVNELVHNVFVQTFGSKIAGLADNYKALSRDIWKAWSVHQQ